MRETRSLVCAFVLTAGLAVGSAAKAEDHKPTQDEVQALTLKAAALIAEKGIGPACQAFNQDGPWKWGEVYVNAIDSQGVWKCYPPKPAGVGKSVLNVRDADGKELVRDIIKVALEHDSGWVEYRWLNPAAHQIQPKVTFVKKVPGADLITYVGVYK